MRVVFLTQYYPPEIGASQNRIAGIATRLAKRGVDVTVLTAMPNYPEFRVRKKYRGRFFVKEEIDGVKVWRSYIFARRGGLALRMICYLSFVFSSIFNGLIRLPKVDALICQSPPLFLGISGAILATFKARKFVFNVSDLWPESAERLGLVKNRFLLWSAGKLADALYRRADLISGQTQGIVANISARFPKKRVYWLRNGVSLEELQSVTEVRQQWRETCGCNGSEFLAVYAGIHGHAQGLEVILDAADILKEKRRIKFALMGDGPRRKHLLKLVRQKGLDNVTMLDSRPRTEVLELLASANAGVVPLRKADIFKGAIPSKIMEVSALRRPLLLGVEGEAKELFISDGNAGLAFEPESAEALATAIVKLADQPELASELGDNGHDYVLRNFDRDKIAADFWHELQRLLSDKVEPKPLALAGEQNTAIKVSARTPRSVARVRRR